MVPVGEGLLFVARLTAFLAGLDAAFLTAFLTTFLTTFFADFFAGFFDAMQVLLKEWGGRLS